MGLWEMWGAWVWFAGVALGITTCLVAIVYMLSELLMNDKMKSWAKMELTEIFYSAIIVGMVVAGLPLIDSVVQGALGVSNSGGNSVTTAYIPTTDFGLITQTREYRKLDICGPEIADASSSVYNSVESCHMRLGIWFMRDMFEEGKSFAFDTYLAYIETTIKSEFTINVEFVFEKRGFFTFNPWRGFYTIGNKIKEMVFDWTTKLMMLMKFQEVFLRFIATALFPSMFVVGVLLRTFPFTRKLGGLLLAIALSLYFVLPSFYALGALIVLEIKNDPYVQAQWHIDKANPDPANNLDPPIANLMYVTGDIHMPGGTGKVSTAAYRSELRKDESMDTDNGNKFTQAMEKGKDAAGNPLASPVDLSSNAFRGASDDQKDAAMKGAYGATMTWFGEVSKKSFIDNYVSFVWEPGGPLDILARLTFWTTFFSLFGLLATIAAIRSLSVTFGGDIEIAGLTRLI